MPDSINADNLDTVNSSGIGTHFGEFYYDPALDVKWSKDLSVLTEVEEYLKSKFPCNGIKLDYDITARHPLNFDTINYTTFAGMLIIHPLTFEQSVRQMSDAYADNIKLNNSHIDLIRDKISNTNDFSKYVFSNPKYIEPKEALVVLPGGNKLKKHCCVGRLEKILQDHGKDNVLFKKHPVSYDEVYEELSDYLGGIHYAPANTKLYDLIKGSDYIYTTMMSESALTSFILNKKVAHFDLLQNRQLTSFGHIGYYLFSTKDPVAWAEQAFASPKSGVIHPSVDEDWKGKIDSYIEYISDLKSFYEYAYL